MKHLSKQVFLFILGGLVVLVLVLVGYLLFTPANTPSVTDREINTSPRASAIQKQPQPNIVTPAHEWSIVLTGDIIPARVTNASMVKRRDFFWPLQNIASVLQNADITLINLESPLTSGCPVTNEGMRFCGDGSFAAALSKAGVDVANLANNHSLNFGWDALDQTEQLLYDRGIVTVGFNALTVDLSNNNYSKVDVDEFLGPRSRLVDTRFFDHSAQIEEKIDQFNCYKNTFCSSLYITEVPKNVPGAVKVGFLGYNAVGQRINREIAEKQIKVADALVDVLIVSVHWGKEYTREPLADAGIAPDDPKELGKLFIEWGADVVAGNHPHWWQRMEKYQDKLIIYAQGNTIFDQEWSVETRKGYLAKLYFDGKNILFNKTEITPIGIRNWGEAYLLEGDEAAQIKQAVFPPN